MWDFRLDGVVHEHQTVQGVLEDVHQIIQRLKALGLSLQEIGDLNAVYGIEGSTAAMLQHLEGLLDRHLGELSARIAQLRSLRDEIQKYRDHVGDRIEALRGGASE